MHGISRLALASALAVAWFAAPVVAQEDDVIELDAITVTANRTATNENQTGVSTSVVTEINRQPAREVGIAGAFARLAGISVSQQGAFGSPVSLRIRGADQRYLAVFIDGVRVTDPTGVQTQFDFGFLPAGGIDRIEILRGSQSALWGGSAVGGVINMTSARPTEEGTTQEVQAEAGSFGTANLRYTLLQKQGDLETSLTLSHLQTDGFSAAASGTEADGGSATRASASLRYQVTDTLAVGASLFHQKAASEFDGYNSSFSALIDKNNSQTKTETGGRLFAELAAGNTDHVFEITGFRVGRDYDEAGALSGFDGRRVTFGWQATTEVSSALKLVYGVDHMTEKAGYTNLPAGAADTTISGAFAQALWAPSADLDISATLRRDDHSSFGAFNTGRLALAWRPTEATTLRFAAATGFRAPSIDELFGDYPNDFFIGNPNLTPEKSQSFEVGIEHNYANDVRLSATVFRLDIDNLIAGHCFDINDNGTPDSTTDDYCNIDYSLNNFAGRSTRQGVELTADVPLNDMLRFGLAYTYTDARRSSDERVGLVPRHDLTASLTAQLRDNLAATVTVKHVAGRLNDFATATMPDYTVVNADMDYDLGQGRSAYLRVENLFDKDYQTSAGYAASGRAVYAGFRASF